MNTGRKGSAIFAGAGYFAAPHAGLNPAHVESLQTACFAVLLAAIYEHERHPPRGGGGKPGLGLFGVRRDKELRGE